jgi:RNA polymerase sigma factor (sigma-70 family)
MHEQPLDQLTANCRQQMHHYYAHQESDPRFCHELLRRAFDEQDHAAAHAAFAVLAPMLHKWLQRQKVAERQREDIVQETLLRLQEYHRQGTFKVATYTLPQVFAYIHRCAILVVLETRRKFNHLHQEYLHDALPADAQNQPEAIAAHRAQLETLLNAACAWLPSEDAATLRATYHHPSLLDTLTLVHLKATLLPVVLRHHLPPEDWQLMELRYIRGKPPRDIAPLLGVPVGDVSARLTKVRRALRTNRALGELFGWKQDD